MYAEAAKIIDNARLSKRLEATLLQTQNKMFTSLLYYKLLPHCQGANTMRNLKFKWYLELTLSSSLIRQILKILGLFANEE